MVALLLAGCVGGDVMPTPTPSASASSAPEPEPEIRLDGTALQNKSYFDKVNRELIERGGDLDGRAFIDNLVAAGYPKNLMEVTPDRTPLGNRTDNIQFSILLNGTCLIGQYGTTGYASTFGPALSTGKCLIGETRPIDW